VVDLGVEYSARRAFLKYAYTRRRRGRWGSIYQWSPLWDRTIQRKLRASLRANTVDAVVEIGDLCELETPFYVYQDLSFDVLERYYDAATGIPGFKGIDLDTIRRRRERQHRIYESATGIFAMSEWFANTLTEWSGVPQEKVKVVYAGLNSVEMELEDVPERQGPPKLLFVGRDFFRKGGESVVKALAHLRREYSTEVRLTVAGPDRWPMRGDVPEGVRFVGDRSTAEVARLYRGHDVFVMPSRFEAFGIAFREALASGLPAVGRAEFAMPEIIEPGKNGALVSSDDPSELAAAVVSVLENPEIRRHTVRTAREVRERFSWDAVAGRMIAAMPGCARTSAVAHAPDGE
jgi:glycosyltransferase involved in cell wall biosynthesis